MGLKPFIASAAAGDLWEQHYKDKMSRELFFDYLRFDPTYKNTDEKSPMGTYGKQLLTWVGNGSFSVGGHLAGSIKGFLSLYDEAVKWLPPEYRSINRFKTAGDFAYFVVNTMPPLLEGVAEERATSGAKVLYEDEDWKLVIPKTHFAAVYYGEGSDWCTSRKNDSNYFNQYSRNGTILICLNKDSRRRSIQAFIPSAESGYGYECRDFLDREESIEERLSPGALNAINSKFGPDTIDALTSWFVSQDDYGNDGEDEEDDVPPEYEVSFSSFRDGFSVRADGGGERVFLVSAVPSEDDDYPFYLLDPEDWEEIDRSPFHCQVGEFALSDVITGMETLLDTSYDAGGAFGAITGSTVWVCDVPFPDEPPNEGMARFVEWVTTHGDVSIKRLRSGKSIIFNPSATSRHPFHSGVVAGFLMCGRVDNIPPAQEEAISYALFGDKMLFGNLKGETAWEALMALDTKVSMVPAQQNDSPGTSLLGVSVNLYFNGTDAVLGPFFFKVTGLSGGQGRENVFALSVDSPSYVQLLQDPELSSRIFDALIAIQAWKPGTAITLNPRFGYARGLLEAFRKAGWEVSTDTGWTVVTKP